MATIKPAFKDYEYGWYGFNGSYNSYWMNSINCHAFIHGWDHKPRYTYRGVYKEILKQLPKLKGVIFIYGNYKDCV